MATTETTKWAVIELGGKQHLVSMNSKINVNQLAKEVGATVEIKSLLDQTPVTLKVLENYRGEKVHGLKFKNKVRYLRHYGHRQNLSSLEVVSIGTKSETKAVAKPVAATAEAKKSVVKKPVAKKTVTKKATK